MQGLIRKSEQRENDYRLWVEDNGYRSRVSRFFLTESFSYFVEVIHVETVQGEILPLQLLHIKAVQT